ncbi:SIR2 family protein [Shinella oryzae]|uniref:SIR2 family protein n=1 Tax=Shinella oryzae TaxID=2871820 RepID=UPI001FF26D15|nr:SIR2 family protein [Shinella oryzae]UPA25357.1 SIR2 family protein [Shinella oryzae]
MAFQDDTVFVVGAGASAEFGLPVGWKLLEKIRNNSRFQFQGTRASDGNEKIIRTVYGRYNLDSYQHKKAFEALDDIHRGVETAGSIDEYINRYSDNSLIAEMGKLQIAYAILLAESQSAMMLPGVEPMNWHPLEGTWIAPFTRALFDGVRAKDVEEIGSNITIICFNYDRCIEHYLEHAIQRAYRDVDHVMAREIVNRMNIIHPYGSLGPLDDLPFGSPVETTNLYDVVENLITWSETIDDHLLIDSIREAVGEAKTLIFLGFAFANQNMKLLDAQVTEAKPYYTRVYATGKGLTDDVDDTLKDKITKLFAPSAVHKKWHGQQIRIKYDMVCKEFMDKQLMNFTV